MNRLALCMIAVAALAAGCHKDDATASGAAPATTSSAVAKTDAPDEVLTEADFEDQAKQQISDQNLDMELDRLADEINGK